MSGMRKIAWVSMVLLVAVAAPVSAAEEKPAPGGKPAGQPAAGEKSAPEKAAPNGPAKETDERFTVPDGTPKELVAYITKLITGPAPRDVETVKKLRKAILEAAEKILAANPNEQEMEFAVQAKMNMLPSHEQLAQFAAELHKGGHQKLARQVRGFMLQIDLRKVAAGSEPTRKRIEEAVKFLQEAPPQASDVTLAYTIGLLAEMGEDRQLAGKTYDAMAKVFAASDNPKLAEFATVLEGVVRRLNLMGQEMKLEGKVLDGEGLEIVGVSLDSKLADLKEFVKANAIPWAIVVGEGKPNPSVAYYGIMSLPTTIVVAKDGKVAALSPRGETLGKELEKLLGPTAAKKE